MSLVHISFLADLLRRGSDWMLCSLVGPGFRETAAILQDQLRPRATIRNHASSHQDVYTLLLPAYFRGSKSPASPLGHTILQYLPGRGVLHRSVLCVPASLLRVDLRPGP